MKNRINKEELLSELLVAFDNWKNKHNFKSSFEELDEIFL